MLLNIATIVPHGLVVFFPSYAFLDQARKLWQDSGLLARLGGKKTVFLEPREGAEVDKVLREYASCIAASSAAAATTPVSIVSLSRWVLV